MPAPVPVLCVFTSADGLPPETLTVSPADGKPTASVVQSALNSLNVIVPPACACPVPLIDPSLPIPLLPGLSAVPVRCALSLTELPKSTVPAGVHTPVLVSKVPEHVARCGVFG